MHNRVIKRMVVFLVVFVHIGRIDIIKIIYRGNMSLKDFSIVHKLG